MAFGTCSRITFVCASWTSLVADSSVEQGEVAVCGVEAFGACACGALIASIVTHVCCGYAGGGGQDIAIFLSDNV